MAAHMAGTIVSCSSCGASMQLPFDTATPPPVQGQQYPPPPSPPPPPFVSPPPSQVVQHYHYGRSAGFSAGIIAPLIVSAIFNILLGLFWISTCIGAIVGVPMIVLAIFEFIAMGKANSGHDRAGTVSMVQVIGVLEIIAGLFNLVSLICGIIVLINLNNERR